MMIRLLSAALAMSALAGCAAHRADASGGARSHSSVRSAAALCRDTFAYSTVLGWDGTDVARLRAYQYGGPVAHVPIRSAFPGVPASAAGAWCLVRQGPDAASLWGAVSGSQPRRAITVTGPGEDRHRGKMQGPPVVP